MSLIQDLKLLTQLLEDPHPGLFTWNLARIQVSDRIKAELDAKPPFVALLNKGPRPAGGD